MKWNKLFIPFLLFGVISVDACFSQVRIHYENPAIYARSGSGEMPTHRGDFIDKGVLQIDIRNSSVSLISDTKTERRFKFHSISHESTSGHYLSFGDQTMFTYLPREGLFNLMYKRNHIYVFQLSSAQISLINTEMKKL